MKKRILLILLFLILSSASIYASPYSDFALMVGSGNFFNPSEGIGFSYGMTIGLTDKLELSLLGMSEALPSFGGRNLIMLELGYSLMGARNTGSKISGICMNSVLSLGCFYRVDRKGCGIYLGISPLAIGAPMTVKRERALRTNIGYDFLNKKLMVTFSPLDIEVYLVGTYRDWVLE